MNKAILSIVFLFALTLSASAQNNVYLKAGDYWTQFYPNTKKIAANITADSDVMVFILDARNLELFRNRKSFQSYYQSGKVTAVSVNVNLRRGQYYLVVSNLHSILTSKNFTVTFF